MKQIFKKWVTRFQQKYPMDPDGSLKILHKFIHDPYLWHFNRHSVATAFSIGLFICYIPIPGQMLVSAILAILFRANLPISVALSWVSNPVTTPAMLYFSYLLGTIILKTPPQTFHFEMSWDWFVREFHSIGLPLIVGTLISAVVIAILSNIAIRLTWRLFLLNAWQKRKLDREKAKM